MKTKRFVSTLLALLLVCSLPVSAFAADDNPAGTTVPEISAGDTMGTNSGTVTNNKGAIYWNNGPGIVTTNDGNVTVNVGTVDTNNGTVYTNNSAVGTNNGTVTTNEGKVTTNSSSGTVTTNNKTVGTNNGTVGTNNNTVTTNNGTVTTNKGEVTTNSSSGTVGTNNKTVTTNDGTVTDNYGTVETNSVTGTVTNKGRGTVETNYGTVTEADGTTWCALQVKDEGSLLQVVKDSVVNLAKLFTKSGYVLSGYTQTYQTGENGLTQASTTVTGTSYTVTCPNVLTLIWQAIVNPAADDGTGSFGPGSFVSINGHKFLLVAAMEDVYCLASVDSFGEEQLSDLPALLASLLTEEQLTHVTGEPELLDEELTARFFGGEGSHIVFPCDKGLIFS